MYGQFLTDRGQLRSINEDAGGVFYNQTNQLLTIVADGMGGHRAGEVASQLAVSIIKEDWELHPCIETPLEAEKYLEEMMTTINSTIYNRSLENKECEGMGTTVVISICTIDFVSIAHIGDSRCYLLNETKFEQLTSDHSLVNELIKTGQISQLDAEKHPRKNVLLKALGTEKNITADIKTINWEPENRLLVCSDGLTNKVSDKEIESYLRSDDNIDSLVKELVNLANARGGEDNITLAIVEKKGQVGDRSC